jgi:hypothetical protein
LVRPGEVGVVGDADRPARADNGRVISHAVHIDIDVRIDGDEIIRPDSAGHRGDQ